MFCSDQHVDHLLKLERVSLFLQFFLSSCKMLCFGGVQLRPFPYIDVELDFDKAFSGNLTKLSFQDKLFQMNKKKKIT